MSVKAVFILHAFLLLRKRSVVALSEPLHSYERGEIMNNPPAKRQEYGDPLGSCKQET